MPHVSLEWILGIVFAAGGAYFFVRRQGKDLNGIGARSRKFERNALLAFMVLAEKREDREYIAKLFRE